MARTTATIRPPAVAGMFYPGEAGALRDTVRGCLASVRLRHAPPKALIAPHAGYLYSGPVAATGYAALAPLRKRITRVVLLGPSHRLAFEGLAVPGVESFATPLGEVPIDHAAVARILRLPGVRTLDAAHAEEHSLEVHLPFLQEVLGDFRLVPVVAGRASPAAVDRVLEALWGGTETLIVISSDLSHYHAYAAAQAMDEAASRAIETLDTEGLTAEQACGRVAVGGLMVRARALDLRATTLDLRNSGDTEGDRGRVVGYGAFAFEYAGRARLPADQRRLLGEIAGDAIAAGAEAGEPDRDETIARDFAGLPRPLLAARACFVTVGLDGALRGCVGSLAADRPLVSDIADNARKAAFGDPRFTPVSAEEAGRLTIGISILSHPRAINARSEAELAAALNPDIDGLILALGSKRGLFLPQVWNHLNDPRDFVRQLKAKAGIRAGMWPRKIEAYRFTTETFEVA